MESWQFEIWIAPDKPHFKVMFEARDEPTARRMLGELVRAVSDTGTRVRVKNFGHVNDADTAP